MDALLSALLEAGLIDADTADIIRRQNDPEAARTWAEQQMAIAAQGALSAQQQRLIYMLRDTDYRPTERDVTWFWDNENELLWDAMRPRILQVLTERATFAAVVGGNAGTFNLVNRQVIAWAETYYVDPSDTTYGSIPNLNLTSRQQFADVFAAWNRGELGGRPQGLPSLIQALVPVFGADRAERIAVTETTRLFTESIRQAGLANPFTTAFRVLTANDELVCPICGPVASQVVAKTDESGAKHPVRGSIGYPPFHVRCRCGITEETERSLKVGQAQPAAGPAPVTEATSASITGDMVALQRAGFTQEQIAQLFNIGPAARAEIVIKDLLSQIEINGKWFNPDTGDEIGECIRSLLPEQKLAHLDVLAFDGSLIGNGTGMKIARQWFTALYDAGYEKAELYAGLSIGRYAWAKEGAEYADPTQAAQSTNLFREWLKQKGISLPDDKYPVFKSVLDVATYVHPQGVTLTGADIANNSVQPDMVLPLGKAFMLDQTFYGHGGWNAVIDLARRGGNGGK